METRKLIPILIAACALAPAAQAGPIPLPHACNGWLVGCADILAPLVEPTKALPLLAPPEADVETASQDPPAAAPPEASAKGAEADADDDGGSWTLREQALLAGAALLAGLALLLFALWIRARRAHRLQEDLDAAWREARRRREAPGGSEGGPRA